MNSINQEMLCFTIGVLLLISNMIVPSDQSTPLAKTRVVLQNSDPDKNVTVHCWSSDDDLGTHELAPNTTFSWHFRVNLWGTTKFVCDFMTYAKIFHCTVFDDGIGNICQGYCFWSITTSYGPCLIVKGQRPICYY
ncbi:hypothetical protein CASFOL_006737 [Castilleja foliolosa]|uniref:S-protein homolog n=1 Tax=Castilleja foliolosa TaxID=1961234 RepID=A0ABD3EB27_9LAMI